MTRSRRLLVLFHLSYWTLYLMLLSFIFAIIRAHSRPSILSLLFASRLGLLLIVPNLFAFYFSYLILFPRFLKPKRYRALLLVGPLAALAIAALAGLALALTFGATSGGVLLLACLALTQMVIAIVLRGFVGWTEDIGVKEELQRGKDQAEAALIRARLDPHFLFNTLNNIDALIQRDPVAASEYLNKLSEILRFVLYEARADQIALEAELAHVARYVALQKIRNRLPDHATLQVRGNPGGLQIAPMVLMPFIENAFKHAAGERGANSISIEIELEGARLTFRCANRHQERPASAAGLGNELVKRRLQLIYPGHRLQLSDLGGVYTVSLGLTLR